MDSEEMQMLKGENGKRREASGSQKSKSQDSDQGLPLGTVSSMEGLLAHEAPQWDSLEHQVCPLCSEQKKTVKKTKVAKCWLPLRGAGKCDPLRAALPRLGFTQRAAPQNVQAWRRTVDQCGLRQNI